MRRAHPREGRGLIDTNGWRSAFSRDADRLAALLGPAGLDRPVPTCPDWRLRDLGHHVVNVLLFWTAIADGSLTEPEAWERRPEVADDSLADAIRAAAAAAEPAIYDLDPGEPRWSWSPHRTAGFIQRRMAHETAIHLADAQSAFGAIEPIDRALAVDGVSELLDTFWAESPEWLARAPAIDLRAVDTDDRWRIGPPDGLPEVSVEATASDLDLLLWRRPTAHTPVIDGDEAAWAEFYDVIAIS